MDTYLDNRGDRGDEQDGVVQRVLAVRLRQPRRHRGQRPGRAGEGDEIQCSAHERGHFSQRPGHRRDRPAAAGGGWTIEPEDLAHISPYLTEHINRFGEYSTHELGIQPEAYDPKLDVDFTQFREQDLSAAGLGQAA
ncbi:MAG TPA: hypothetical protein DEQ61_21880 [Streptomyces sp.]|nr:hypothetical protein [Streptomyces sp.]